MNDQTTIFLTGATGILGSNILFELLPFYVTGKLKGKIVLLIRPCRSKSPEQRIREILTNPSIPHNIRSIPADDWLKFLVIINSELNNFSAKELPCGTTNYTVIHAAASVDLGQNAITGKEIETNNYQGTIHLLNELSHVCKKFIFVSTAYSSGHRKGEIGNDFLITDNYLFRNPYERYKHETEKYIKEFCQNHNIEWKIFRPSIICGRLIEPPFYAISRFIVFYLFARYASVMRNKFNGSTLRLHVPEKAVINIVPVDFVAKTVIASMESPVQQLNIVHPENVSCRELFKNGFKLIKFNNFSFVEEVPQDITPMEKTLYTTIGQQLGPYIDTPEHHFDTKELFDLMKGTYLPEVEEHFCGLLEFAANHRFSALY